MAKKNKKDQVNEFDLNGDMEIVLEEDMGSSFNKSDATLNIVDTDSKKKTNNSNKNGKKKVSKNKKKKDEDLSKAQLCEKYNPKCTQSRYWQITIVATILAIGVGIGYQLSFPFLIIVAVVAFFLTQKSILHICRNMYENQKIEDVGSYVEQMLYSFRRNSKILASLQDTVSIFDDGEMKDAIQEAIDYIIQTSTTGNIYEEALSIIQDKYDCRRIRSLHRFLIKVEGVGGDHELGVSALINDRRMWLERVDDYKKEKSAVLKEIIISCIFSSIICAITMYMLPSYVGSMKHIVSRLGSTAYILVNFFTVSQTLKHTVFYLNDTYTPEEEMALLTKFRWFKTWDKKVETKKGLKPAIMMVVIGIVALILGYWWMLLICLGLAAFSYFVQPIMRHNGARKNITREIEKAYPDWLLELSLLLQTENLHVALEKTLDTAPKILQDDLIQLGDDVATYPTEVFPYTNFLHDINVTNIHSSMKLLYSIATYGSEEEEKQIAELVERNATLMNKAEQVKNTDRLAKVYIYKFIPMAASALKLICDMGVFLVMFISQSLSAL